MSNKLAVLQLVMHMAILAEGITHKKGNSRITFVMRLFPFSPFQKKFFAFFFTSSYVSKLVFSIERFSFIIC